jgi:hypothetical protein
MTTQLVVVIPMPATLGLPGSANLPVPANVRAVTASCSPATEGGPLRWRNFYARHFRPAVARARLPKQLLFPDLRHACAALLIANGPAYGGNEGSPRAVVDFGSRPIGTANCSRVLVGKSPTGSTGLFLPECSLGRRGRRAAATPPAPRLSTRGRSESLNRAFSGGCEYPVEEPPPSAPSKKREAGGQDRGLPPCSRLAPQQQVMRRTNPGQVGSVLPHPRAYGHGVSARETARGGLISPRSDTHERRARSRDLAEPERNRRYAASKQHEHIRADRAYVFIW